MKYKGKFNVELKCRAEDKEDAFFKAGGFLTKVVDGIRVSI